MTQIAKPIYIPANAVTNNIDLLYKLLTSLKYLKCTCQVYKYKQSNCVHDYWIVCEFIAHFNCVSTDPIIDYNRYLLPSHNRVRSGQVVSLCSFYVSSPPPRYLPSTCALFSLVVTQFLFLSTRAHHSLPPSLVLNPSYIRNFQDHLPLVQHSYFQSYQTRPYPPNRFHFWYNHMYIIRCPIGTSPTFIRATPILNTCRTYRLHWCSSISEPKSKTAISTLDYTMTSYQLYA